MKKKRRKVTKERDFEQISIGDIKIRIGDKLFQNGKLYAEVMGESEELYFLQKSGSNCEMPSPYFKETIIENILFGKLFLEQLSFK